MKKMGIWLCAAQGKYVRAKSEDTHFQIERCEWVYFDIREV